MFITEKKGSFYESLKLEDSIRRSAVMIDDIDYTILKCLHDADEAFWKKRIHQEIQDRWAELPITDEMSLQTVGRRVDKLHDEGYLENTIVSPQNVPRDLIIGYNLTDAGQDTVTSKREILLKKIVRNELFSDETTPTIGQKALAELINNEFGLDGHTVETANHYSRDELLLLLGTYFLEKKASNVFGDEDVQRFRQTIMERKPPSTIL